VKSRFDPHFVSFFPCLFIPLSWGHHVFSPPLGKPQVTFFFPPSRFHFPFFFSPSRARSLRPSCPPAAVYAPPPPPLLSLFYPHPSHSRSSGPERPLCAAVILFFTRSPEKNPRRPDVSSGLRLLLALPSETSPPKLRRPLCPSPPRPRSGFLNESDANYWPSPISLFSLPPFSCHPPLLWRAERLPLPSLP